jgi:tRNA nucleotidyltransferase (CCA-adding enzyme)
VEGNPSGIVRELGKGGAQVVSEEPKLRETELIFHGDVDGSVAAARDEVYALPGTRPEHHWATIMEDLRRRDFSCNAVAISLNPASRGLLLDPTNGLADIERREVRALSIHCFTNQPARLLRILRYAARLSFQMESRTGEWFELAMERGLDKQIPAADVGRELRNVGNEERPAAVIKSWESHGLLGTIHPRLARATEQMTSAGLKVRLFAPVTWYLLRRLTSREQALALRKMGLRGDEVSSVAKLEAAAKEAVKALKGRQTEAPKDAFRYLEKLPRDVMAFLQTEHANPRINNKIRNYLHKWRPMRLSRPAAELEALGVARGPQFDSILDQFFDLQLKGKGKTVIDREKLLRQLAGIMPEPKTKKKSEKKAGKAAAKAKPVPKEKPAASKAAPKVKAAASKVVPKVKPAAKAKPSSIKVARKAKLVAAAKAKPKGKSAPKKTRAHAKPARGRKKAARRR